MSGEVFLPSVIAFLRPVNSSYPKLKLDTKLIDGTKLLVTRIVAAD